MKSLGCLQGDQKQGSHSIYLNTQLHVRKVPTVK